MFIPSTMTGGAELVTQADGDRRSMVDCNVKPVKLATAGDVNTEQLLAFEKILVTEKGLEKLAERTNGK